MLRYMRMYMDMDMYMDMYMHMSHVHYITYM